MNVRNTTNFKATALNLDTLRNRAPSIFASGPMLGVSGRYTFVSTARIVEGLQELGWVPVEVEEQRIRSEARRGFQKHLIRFRRTDQMEHLNEWNIELLLVNSHDAGCAYQVHGGIYRRLCHNGLVLSEGSFEALRFRHARLEPAAIMDASFRLMEQLPNLDVRIHQFRHRLLDARESRSLAEHALGLRYPSIDVAPVDPETLLKVQRPEDEGTDLWLTMNRIQENLVCGGVSDWRRDKRNRLRSVRALRGIDSKVGLNKGLWELAERMADGKPLAERGVQSLTV